MHGRRCRAQPRSRRVVARATVLSTSGSCCASTVEGCSETNGALSAGTETHNIYLSIVLRLFSRLHSRGFSSLSIVEAPHISAVQLRWYTYVTTHDRSTHITHNGSGTGFYNSATVYTCV
jgi:hypothetical protein